MHHKESILKAVRPKANGKKSEGKTFTLRNIQTQQTQTCGQLKSLIKAHLDKEVTSM